MADPIAVQVADMLAPFVRASATPDAPEDVVEALLADVRAEITRRAVDDVLADLRAELLRRLA